MLHDGGQLGVVEAQGGGIELFDPQRVGHLPQGVAARTQDERQAFIAPDQCPLGIGQREHQRLGLKFRPGLERLQKRMTNVRLQRAKDGDFRRDLAKQA